MRRNGLAAMTTLLSLAAACTPGSQPTEPERPAQQPAETESVEVPVVHDFGVTGLVPHTVLSNVHARAIEVGEGRAAIIAIERPYISASCVTAAQLRLYLVQASDLAAGQLAVYPSSVFNALAKQDGVHYGYSGSALDIRPRATLDQAAPGWSQWDITDIVKRWIGHKPFPSRGLVAPMKGPIVLTVRDVDGAEPFATATFVSSDANDRKPYLIVTRTEDCGAA